MSTTPDYGEPWKTEPGTHSIGDTGDFDGYVELRTREEIRVSEVWNPDDQQEAFLKRIVACINSCSGMADPAAEIEAMREAIREAHDALENCAEFIQDAHIIEAQWHWEPVKQAKAALAKLKPFIKP